MSAGFKDPVFGNFKVMNSEELYEYQKDVYPNLLFGLARPSSLKSTDYDWIGNSYTRSPISSYYISASGGTENIPGKVDINPDVVRYLFDYYLGGAGRFVTNTAATAEDVKKKFIEGQPIDWSWKNTPIARRFWGEIPKFVDDAKLYERKEVLQQWVAEYKGEGRKVPISKKEVNKLNAKLKSVEGRLKAYRKQRDRIYKMPEGIEKVKKLNAWEKKYYPTVAEFNKLWEEIVEKRK